MNIYETVTNRIIDALEQGVIPWRKEWQASAASGIPINYTTKKPYRGINVFVLLCAQFGSNQWLTYKQAQDAGLQVRKGSKGMPIVFWKFDTRKDAVTGETDKIAFARQYTVFNIEQCDGVPVALPFETPEFHPIDEADKLSAAYLERTGIRLHHGGDKAFYAPVMDSVTMPALQAFSTPDAYYSTLFHEYAHSTGHASRLKRFEHIGQFDFGSESYSKEELIAEFGAAFLCAETGIVNESVLTNHAAYIQGWLRKLKNDTQLAIQAAQRAQRAADCILDRTYNTETTTDAE
jgi:antirestriction protein ArdC